MAAKILGHWGAVNVAIGERVSPPVALLVALLSIPQKVEGAELSVGVMKAAVVLQGARLVGGQPEGTVFLVEEWLGWAVVVLVVAVGCVVCWSIWGVGFRAPVEAPQDSQAPVEAPLQDSHAPVEASLQDFQAPATLHVFQVLEEVPSHNFGPLTLQTAMSSGSQVISHAYPIPASSSDNVAVIQEIQGAQARETHEGSNRLPAASVIATGGLVERGELCEFPMVGRVDWRSNWVPSHYLRWLLSVVGATLVQLVGVDDVEVWRLRAVARTFRYGIAFACERARGEGLRTPWGVAIDTLGPGRPIVEAPRGSEPIADPQVDDDPTIDEVRHVHPDEIPRDGIVDVQMFQPEELSSPSEFSEESSTASGSSGEGPSELHSAEQELAQSSATGETEPAALSPLRNTQGVGYRAVDGALLVVYADDELRIPLPGWTFEEVWSIVYSIQCGEWPRFHQVMEWGASQVAWGRGPRTQSNSGLAPGEIALGGVEEGDSDEADDMPALESLPISGSEGEGDSERADDFPVLESLSISRTAGEDGSEEADEISALENLPITPFSVGESLAVVVGYMGVVGWLFCASLWVIGLGVALGSFMWVVGLIPGGEEAVCSTRAAVEQCHGENYGEAANEVNPATVGLAVVWVLSMLYRVGWLLIGLRGFPLRFEGCLPDFMVPVSVPCFGGWWLWLFLVVLFSLVHSSGAYPIGDFGQVDVYQGAGLCVASALGSSEGPADDGYGGLYLGVLVVVVVTVWETFKRVMCQRRLRFTTAESQTDIMAQVPLPLEPGVPNRAQILYCLWRAGYHINVDPYPLGVQDDFHRYVGSYLRRQAVDEDSSD